MSVFVLRALAGPAPVRADPITQRVNERACEIARGFRGIEDVPLELWCECGCGATVRVTIGEYEALAGAPLLARHSS